MDPMATSLPPLQPGKTRRTDNNSANYMRASLPSPNTLPPLSTTEGSPDSHQSVNLGKAVNGGKDNAVYTTKYNLLTFLPIAIREQFRRNGNVYFLCIGGLMLVGEYYPDLYNTSVNPWTTLGPLAFVVTISLLQEGMADLKRRTSDFDNNNHPCVVLRRDDDIGKCNRIKNIYDGNDIIVKLLTQVKPSARRKSLDIASPSMADNVSTANIAFASTKRKDIRVGEIVLIRNREMVPADIVILGSSGENGSAYVETSQIDGETNLKLRKSPKLPDGAIIVSTPKGLGGDQAESYQHPKFESISQAVKRITRLSHLGYPNGVSILNDPSNVSSNDHNSFRPPARQPSLMEMAKSMSMTKEVVDKYDPKIRPGTKYITTLTSEQPNASINTFLGKITLPPTNPRTTGVNIPLDVNNFLLRGAALRNTDWVIGVACFTGADTKLVRNSVKTPSKFSRLDILVNRTVILIFSVLLIFVIGLGFSFSKVHNERFDTLFYIGLNKDKTEPWPYLSGLEAPKWSSKPQNAFQSMLNFVTLLNNFIPLSLYVTVEIATMFMIFLIRSDKNMYHKETDTCAVARSTIVSDLGQVQYIFSDKTGTLTQNVMQFKRCSVDGMMFGAPVEKSAPLRRDSGTDFLCQEFHPLKKLLVGLVTVSHENVSNELSETGLSRLSKSEASVGAEPLTFNAEMFLRVMSICHTVVVEKELDPSGIGANKSEGDSVNSGMSGLLNLWKRPRTVTEDSVNNSFMPIRESPEEGIETTTGSSFEFDPYTENDYGSQNISGISAVPNGSNGAPGGYTYQAESPDEEALVSAASTEYGFQLTRRDADGLTIKCGHPSLLSNKAIANGLKNGTTSAKILASQTASPQLNANTFPSLNQGRSDLDCVEVDLDHDLEMISLNRPGEETWDILAVNKFDSTRKMMSVVVQSPPELGSIYMLLCKGADSAMLDPNVCATNDHVMSTTPGEDEDGSAWESSNLLGIQAHLGAFASEGLRTLVLGIRILSEQECMNWVEKYNKASASLVSRDLLLTSLATEIEKNIHIVGTTAIEDKLQDGVPDTISNIAKAGIKLWVLTGDKRETAIEIGYSTKVLDPSMHLTDVSDGSVLRARALVAMEFMRLVKIGKLSIYQNDALQKQLESSFGHFFKRTRSLYRSTLRDYRRFYHKHLGTFCGFCNKDKCEKALHKISEEEAAEEDSYLLRKRVRSRVEEAIKEYRQSEEYQRSKEELVQSGSDRPLFNPMSTESDATNDSVVSGVFRRASSAINESLKRQNTEKELRSITIASMTSNGIADLKQNSTDESEVPHNFIDEDILSLQSFVPGTTEEFKSYFNKKKRTYLERMFATDRDVRKGTLYKHLTKQKKEILQDGHLTDFEALPMVSSTKEKKGMNQYQRRALVIEGAALAHFLGDPCYEEMLFAVASCCESVIACRVSPRQKSLLVKLVRDFVEPSPVTLAIGDGANDVGMIQEAHVGVGISGLEGQQAVNASDFAIAQFRFLEELLLVHGRWNFIRLSKVILFSFYKNALLASLLICYSPTVLFSGTPLFDEWIIGCFNFVSTWPILFLGFFDRDLERDYTKRNPHLYAAGPANESLCLRATLRWAMLVGVHALIIYFFSNGILGGVGAGMSSAFKGLMHNKSVHGDGEGDNIQVYGTLIFVCLNWILAIKVLFESSSIIHGHGFWPAFVCRKNVSEGFFSRVAYTWHGVFWMSTFFLIVGLLIYQIIARRGLNTDAYSVTPFVGIPYHMFETRAITFMALIAVILSAVAADVVMKVFSNMFYPTQTQIHKEIQRKERQRENTDNTY